MRRADRLFRIIQVLRRGRVVTAQRLAEELEVSVRTVYRDVADLMASGVPIDAEAGVGYLLRGYDLPPLTFTLDEIEALVLGARVVESWGDPALASAAREVLAKVEMVLPAGREEAIRKTALFAPEWHGRPAMRVDFAALRRAVRERRKVRLAYVDAHGAVSFRLVRPLGLSFYGTIWLLVAWCELRVDFRTFRPDRIRELEVTAERFVDEPGRTIEDYVALMQARIEAMEPQPA